MARPKKETLQHRKAFDLYLSLGPDRSVIEVGRRLSKSKTTIQNWSQAFGWAKRIEEAEQRIADRASAKVESGLVEMNARHMNIAKAVQGLFVKRLRGALDENGDLKPKGYKPSALDAKAWAEVERDIVAGAQASGQLEGIRFDGKAAEEIGIERLERIVIERTTRIVAARKRGDPGSRL